MVLAALIGGIMLGALAGIVDPALGRSAGAIADAVGGLWIDALRMTVIPLIVALVVTGVAGTADEQGLVPWRPLLLFVALLGMAALICVVVEPRFFIPETGGAAARAAAGLAPVEAVPVPPFGDWLRGFIPANVVSAAADGRLVSLVLFAVLFGAALTRLSADKRGTLIQFFAALRDAMMGIVNWVLWLAPIGVFALGFAAASANFGGLLSIGWRFVAAQGLATLLIIAALFVVVAVVRKARFAGFARAMVEPAVLALASRSSLACFPAMIRSAETMRLDPEPAATTLSLAVSLFKITAPVTLLAMIPAMAAFDGRSLNEGELGLLALIGIVNSVAIAGLPAQVTLLATTLPAAEALGVPLTVLPLMVALDTLPDMLRTVANVVGDLTAAALLSPTLKETTR